MTRDQLETAVRTATSEIQRRNRQRYFAIALPNGDRGPVVTTDEMNKIIMQFLDSATEGIGE